MKTLGYSQAMLVTSVALALSCVGCGSGINNFAATSLLVTPATATVQQGATSTFAISGATDAASCQWQSSDPSVLVPTGGGSFIGAQPGAAKAQAVCGGVAAYSSVVVAAPAAPGPIKITTGGTYSGTWSSSDPNVPAVTIATDQPVTIQNSTISGKGTLIFARGGSTGTQLTVNNVTGIALDPGVSGMQRGRFADLGYAHSVVITNNTMTGVSFGVTIGKSALTQLVINNNSATDLQDRASDGQGGLTNTRPQAGHFVYLTAVSVSTGGEIAWNQVINTPGNASVEDLINISNSQGTAAIPMAIHDNYLQGAFAPTEKNYSGSGIATDGGVDGPLPVTGFVHIFQNQIVHTANVGIGLAAGHDVAITNNRVVSCGQDASGTWYATGGNVGIFMWNYYKSAQFFNNSVSGNGGGLVGPNAQGNPVVSDLWTPDASVAQNNVVGTNAFTDPCMVGGTVNVQAEAAELATWKSKLTTAAQRVGVNHP